MTFANFLREVEKYLRVKNTRTKELILISTNEAILEFARMKEWLKLKVVDDITLDDSDTYTLDVTNILNNYGEEVMLLSSTGTPYDKYDYQDYLQLNTTVKSTAYAIVGDVMYVTGDATTLKFIHISPGLFTTYPITTRTSTQEPKALVYYTDIIKKMVVVKMLALLEDEAVATERQLLQTMLTILIRNENRANNNGKLKIVMRNSDRR